MDEAAADIRELMVDLIEQMIHQVVADIGAGGVGDRSRNAIVHHLFDHCFDWQLGEVSVRAVLIDLFTLWNVAFVVRAAGRAVLAVDGDTLRVHRGSAAGLTDQNDDVRFLAADKLLNLFAALVEDNRDLGFDNLRAHDLIWQQADSFEGRIHCLFAEWLKTGNQNFHGTFSFFIKNSVFFHEVTLMNQTAGRPFFIISVLSA